MRKGIWWVAALALVVFWVQAGVCQTIESEAKPREFYWTEAQKIKTGVTSEEEVRKLLGTPSYSTGGIKAKSSGRRLEKQNSYLYYGPLPEQESEVMKYAVKVVIDKDTGKVKKLVIHKPK